MAGPGRRSATSEYPTPELVARLLPAPIESRETEMLQFLSRIPTQSQKRAARVLIPVAGVSAVTGLVFTGLGIAGGETVEKCTGHLMFKKCKDVYYDWSVGTSVFLISAGIGLLIFAVVCLIAALRLTTMQAHLKRYLAILRGVETMSIQQISGITNSRPSKVRSEIQTMIDSEMIRDFYIDYAADRVVSQRYIPEESHKTVVKCTECGGNNELIVGITKPCAFCGQPLLLGTN